MSTSRGLGVLLTSILLFGTRSISGAAWTVPGVVITPGLNGTRLDRTEVTIHLKIESVCP